MLLLMKNVTPDLHTQLTVLKLCLHWCEQSKYQMQQEESRKINDRIEQFLTENFL